MDDFYLTKSFKNDYNDLNLLLEVYMKKHIQFKYYKPRRDSATFDIIDTEEIYSKQIIITEMQRKTAQRNVPIMAKIYPETFFNLALAKGELKIPSLVEIALYLVMKLDTKNLSLIHI